MEPEKILLIDDDLDLLSAMSRVLRSKFKIFTVSDPQDGLQFIREKGPFGVIIADMHMPGINGIELLRQSIDISPESVRMLLTGDTDMETAAKAVNEGQVYRYLLKPCPPAKMVESLENALKQYRTIRSDQELLSNTLNSCVTVLMDILAMSRPEAFSRTRRLNYYVSQIAKRLKLENAWQYEIAAMLSQLGFVGVPAETITRYCANKELSSVEHNIIKRQFLISRHLIGTIPRLENVARIIENLSDDHGTSFKEALENRDVVTIGTHIIKTANEFDLLLSGGLSKEATVQQLQRSPQKYDPFIVGLMQNIDITIRENMKKLIKVTRLLEGMVIAEDIKTRDNKVIFPQDTVVNNVIQQALLNYSKQKIIGDTISVFTTKQVGR